MQNCFSFPSFLFLKQTFFLVKSLFRCQRQRKSCPSKQPILSVSQTKFLLSSSSSSSATTTTATIITTTTTTCVQPTPFLTVFPHSFLNLLAIMPLMTENHDCCINGLNGTFVDSIPAISVFY